MTIKKIISEDYHYKKFSLRSCH